MRYPAALRAIPIAISIFAVPAGAQDKIDREATVRITTATTQVKGYLSDMDSAALRIYSAGKPVDFTRRDITRLEVRHSRAGRGAAIGGIGGSLIGAAFGALAVEGFCETSSGCESDIPAGMLVGGVIFGSVGALGGGLIGAFIPVWTPVDPTTVSFRMTYRP